MSLPSGIEWISRPRPAACVASFALVSALTWAWLLTWSCDDAFISFRYARQLVAGHGLVFNPGEYVEGYSNFAWTLWIAVGLLLGVDAEAWAAGWSLAAFAGLLGLLGGVTRRLSGGLPIALLLAAAHRDLCAFATSGLETAAFTCVVFLGYVLLVRRVGAAVPGVAGAGLARRYASIGVVFGLAALTRADGAVFGVLATLAVAVLVGVRPALGLVAGCASLVLPFLAWRLHYYGDLLPNTYYAKSAYLTWWSQGWRYLTLYFAKYWVLLPLFAVAAVAVLAGFVRGWRRTQGLGWKRRVETARAALVADPLRIHLFAAAVFAIGHTLYVVRVGGDFMFARFLIPATPFYLVIAEVGLLLALRSGSRSMPRGLPLAVGVALLAMVCAPDPLAGGGMRHGVIDESRFYARTENWTVRARRQARAIDEYCRGLPVRIAIFGSQARIAYFCESATFVEAATGLTDRELARRPLLARGRPGHEKVATAAGLRRRGVHFTFPLPPEREAGFSRVIPYREVRFGPAHPMRVIHWDADLMRALEERGARIRGGEAEAAVPPR